MPKLDKMVREKKKYLLTPAHDTTSARTELKALEDGFKGWNDTVNDYKATNNLKSNQLPKAKNWFSGWVQSHETPWYDSDWGGPFTWNRHSKLAKDVNHWSSLLPETLFNLREPLSVSQAVRDAAGPLEDTYTVEFSGGGGLMEFDLADEHVKSSTAKMGAPSENSYGHHALTGTNPGEMKFPGLILKVDAELVQNSETSESHSKSTDRASSTEISFVLGDGDSDDHFVVDIYTDPKYGKWMQS